MTGGTENHLVILDLTSFGITGRQAELALREAGVTVNRNTIPFDKNGPWYTSGIRIGSPAMTTLGMKENEMAEIASILVDVLKNTKPAIVEKTGKHSLARFITIPQSHKRAKARVKELLSQFPLYPEIPIN